MGILLKVEHASYSPKELVLFKKNKKQVAILNDISFEIKEGEVLGIVGESGSGKTTLIKVIAGILKHDNGSIIFNHNSDDSKVNPIQILFQNTNELINPLRKVGDILIESYKNKTKLDEICRLLVIKNEMFGKIGSQLSGGERQRIGLARILSADPKLLILDEPFSAQDPDSQKGFLDLFKKIKNELNITMICVSHDIKLLKQLVDNMIVLFNGKIMESGNAEKLFNLLRHPYTNFLNEAFDYKLSRSDFKESSQSVKTNDGCAYFSRCDRSTDRCLESVEEINSGGVSTYCNHPL